MAMIKRLTLAVSLLLACAAGAETPMRMTAKPEALIVFSRDLRMGARIVNEAGTGVIASLSKPALIQLEAGFWTDKRLKTASGTMVRLRCTARFVMADGSRSKVVLNKICHKGDLAKTADAWTLMPLNFRFRPVASDPAGVMGVELTVTDEISGKTGVMLPTFDWQGGHE